MQNGLYDHESEFTTVYQMWTCLGDIKKCELKNCVWNDKLDQHQYNLQPKHNFYNVIQAICLHLELEFRLKIISHFREMMV